MCNFFSFITKGDGVGIYSRGGAQSHALIAEEARVSEDRVNKYEYSLGRLKVDQINTVYDREGAEKWVRKFILTPKWERVQLEAVKRDGWVIKYIESPSEAVKLEAVKQDGWAIQYIVNPSEEVKLMAVKQDGEAIKYIVNPSEEVQLMAKRNK